MKSKISNILKLNNILLKIKLKIYFYIFYLKLHFTKWIKYLSIKRNGQFHNIDTTY